MKKSMLKILCCLICVLLATTACANAPGGGGSGQAGGNAASAKPVKLTMWHIWSSETGAANKHPIYGALDALKKAYPNIVVEDESVENDAFKIKIKTAMAADEGPDLFYTWVPGFSSPFVNAGKVLCLDKYIDNETKEKLLPGSLGNVTYDGKVYGMPGDSWMGLMFYNTELFEQCGLEIPKTYDDFKNVMASFIAKDVKPMSIGLKDNWFVGQLHNTIVAQTFGVSNIYDAIFGKGSAKFTDASFIESAVKLLDVLDATGETRETLFGLGYEEMGSAFQQGKAAMIFDGSWMAGQWAGDGSAVKDKFTCGYFPQIIPGPISMGGGSSGAFMATSKTKYPAEAATAVKVISENFSKSSYEGGFGLPSWNVSVDESALLKITVEMAEVSKKGSAFTLNFDTIMEPAPANEYLGFLMELCAGSLTPEVFAQRVQGAVDAGLASK